MILPLECPKEEEEKEMKEVESVIDANNDSDCRGTTNTNGDGTNIQLLLQVHFSNQSLKPGAVLNVIWEAID